MEKFDEIIKCPKSGGDLCYKIQITPDITMYHSLSCGFWTNTLMKEGEAFYEEQMATLPELYKDLAWKDSETELVWIPSTVNQEGKGMIFPIGESINNWMWAAVPSLPIPEEERKNHPNPTNPQQLLEYKTDMTKMEKFPERNYVMALDYVGLLKEEENLAS